MWPSNVLRHDRGHHAGASQKISKLVLLATFLAISACLPAILLFVSSAFATCLRRVELQADVTTATMLFTMVEALEAAKAPLQHVYFSQGIKYYVRAHTQGGQALMLLCFGGGNSACASPAC